MNELYLLITVIGRKMLPDVLSLYQEAGMRINIVTLGHGTAANETMNLLGLDGSEKAVCFSPVTASVWKEARGALRKRLRIDVPGVGIAFTVPFSSIAGKRELAFLSAGQGFEKGEEQEMKGTDRELLVVISNQGYSETVMDAARSVGAAGGTVIHARGTGMETAERFFGVTLASEKDVIFIVTKTARKNDIMQAIVKEAGMDSPAKAIVFSLPVTDTAGLKLIDMDEEAEA